MAGYLKNACICKDVDLLLMCTLEENDAKGPSLNLDEFLPISRKTHFSYMSLSTRYGWNVADMA